MPIRLRPRHLISVALVSVAALLVAAVPSLAGTTWAAVVSVLAAVPLLALLALGVVWISGLASNSVALSAALPGLTVRRALLLSLSGSAVANVLPLGGAAGVGLNYAMTRRWGFSAAGFSAYTVTTNVVDVGAKLVLIGGAGLLLGLEGSTAALHGGAPVLPLLLLPPLTLALLLHPATAGRVGHGLDVLAGGLTRRVTGRAVQTRLAQRLPALSARTGDLIRGHWRRLFLGTGGYLALLTLLLGACLHTAGVHLSVSLLVAGVAADRILTLLPTTPGGVGVVEGGTALALISLGAPAAPVVSGVLLYRAFTYFAEIPVGGLAALVWTLRSRRAAPTAAPVLEQGSPVR